ncbi:MAG: hypothetical protein ACREQY_18920 [Candidatus Binatia bacterium]
MRITFDPAKRQRNSAERGLDFEDALLVFAGVTVEIEDRRREFSMKKANAREQAKLAPYFEI